MSDPADSHAEDLKAQLRKKFGTLQSFEKKFGLDRDTASAGLRRPFEAVETAVAKALNRPAHILWPSRYHPDGSRRRPQPTSNYAAARGKSEAYLAAPSRREG